MDLLHEKLTFTVIGAAMEVHRELGPGFLESVHQRAVEVELKRRDIAFEAQKRISVDYRGELVGDHVIDLVVEDKVIVELKAVKELSNQHRAQVISYLKASCLPVGLLINFAKQSLEHRRVVLSDTLSQSFGSPNPRNPRNPL